MTKESSKIRVPIQNKIIHTNLHSHYFCTHKPSVVGTIWDATLYQQVHNQFKICIDKRKGDILLNC